MSSQPVDLSHALPYETAYFDNRLAVDRSDLNIAALLGVDGDVSDEVLVSLCGAPAGSEIQAYLDSTGRLTFSVTHSALIRSENRISVFRESDTSLLELKPIDLADSAIGGLGAAMPWRIVRACDTLGIARIAPPHPRRQFPQTRGQRAHRLDRDVLGTLSSHSRTARSAAPAAAARGGPRRCRATHPGDRRADAFKMKGDGGNPM
ncbi:MAG TPA: hypothetical protein VJR91_06405 [Burkholderia sp.]|nr:hypothetical protein [Burkholderia sp.]